ncbi:recombinase family protein [Chloroflexota bacterium]
MWTSLDVLTCPDIQKLLDWVRKGEIGAIAVWHIDRLSGEPADKLPIIKELGRFGVKVLSKNSLILEGREGELINFLSAWEKKGSVLRTQLGAKKGLSDRAKLKGLPPTRKQVFGMKFGDEKYIPDANYDNARLIFNLWFEQHKLDFICRELVKRGIPTSTGKHIWLPSSAIAILKNPVYAGRVATLKYEKVEPKKRLKNTFGKTSRRIRPESEWHWLERCVEAPIITWEQHSSILERLKLNKVNAGRNAKHDYLAKGIIECMLCGRHYYGVKLSTGRRIYTCSNHWGIPSYREKCMAKLLDGEAVEHDIKAKVRTFLEQPEIFLRQLDSNLSQSNDGKQAIEIKVKDLERQHRRTIEDEVKALRLLSEEAFQPEQKVILTKRQRLPEELEGQKQKLADLTRFEVNQDQVSELRHRLHNNLDNASFADWRFIIDMLGVKVLSFGDGSWDIEVSVPASETSIANNTPLSIHL